MGEELKPAFYAIIPADVRYDKSLKPNAKLLYGEITALCNERGYCWAGNEYFAKLYDVSIKTISAWISQLVDKKYLTRKLIYKPGTKEIDARILRLPMPYPLTSENGIPSPSKNGEGVSGLDKDLPSANGQDTPTVKKGIPTPKKKEENITLEFINEVFNKNQDLKNYQNFIPLVERWLKYKKEEKKQRYKTEDSLITWIRKLIKYSAGNFIIAEEIIETAISNLWQGIQEPKKPNYKRSIITDFTPKNETNVNYGGW